MTKLVINYRQRFRKEDVLQEGDDTEFNDVINNSMNQEEGNTEIEEQEDNIVVDIRAAREEVIINGF